MHIPVTNVHVSTYFLEFFLQCYKNLSDRFKFPLADSFKTNCLDLELMIKIITCSQQAK